MLLIVRTFATHMHAILMSNNAICATIRMNENDRRKYHQGSREIFENSFRIIFALNKVLSYFDIEPNNGNYRRNYRRVLYHRLPSTNTIGPHPRRIAFTCHTSISMKFARREPICRRYIWIEHSSRSTNSFKSEQTNYKSIVQIHFKIKTLSRLLQFLRIL